MDLGWYFLNVSRLQNAADAAALAGAQDLVARNDTFNGYRIVLVDKKFAGYPEPDEDISTADSDKEAANYARKNLSRDEEATALQGDSENAYAYTMTDSWSPNASAVTMTPHLGQNGDVFYYVVHLTEDIRHFLMPGRYEPMPAPVIAVAMLFKDYDPYVPPPEDPIIPRDPGVGAEGELPEGENLLNQVYNLEDVSAIRNWEWQDFYIKGSVTYGDNIPSKYKDLKGTTVKPKEAYKELTGKDIYGGDWNEFQDRRKGKRVSYNPDDYYYRTEIVSVQAESSDAKNLVTSTNPQTKYDSLNLDFHPDLNSSKLTGNQFSADWDIGYPVPENKKLIDIQNDRSSKADSTEERTFKLRIHSTFNFETPYPVRTSGKLLDKTKNPEDALYVRIESEPIIPLPFVKNQSSEHTVYSTVRQIILNINQPNMGENDRPLVLYYDGPEQINPKALDADGNHVRDSQPVILNLNADARVILFAPNSPVVIRGNGNTMQGFVIAKKFVQLTTKDDYTKENGRYFKDGKEYFYVEEEDTFIDEYGNVQTKPLNKSDVRDPDYIAKLKTDEDRTDYADNLKDKDYFLALKADTNYADSSEMPENTGNIGGLEYEVIYKNTAFGLSANSYYDSFKIAELKREVYSYLDKYKGDTSKASKDMFFTKTRASWID